MCVCEYFMVRGTIFIADYNKSDQLDQIAPQYYSYC